MGEIKFVAGIVMAILFSIAIVGYVMNYSNDNNSIVTLDSNFDSYKTNQEGDIGSLKESVNGSSTTFYTNKISGSSDTTETGAEFKVGLGDILSSTGRIFSLINKNILGGDTNLGIFLTALSTLMLMIGLRYIWKTWKGGNPD